MKELEYEGKIFTDSMDLYEHIIAFKNAEDDYGDGDLQLKLIMLILKI